jgi:isohexenylglutaconyl-CoA hydratase
VLRGAGGNFSAGADLKDMAGARARLAEDPSAIASINASFGHLCNAFADTRLAVVAALEGAVMGGGFGLSCVADVVVAAESTVFRLPETSLGVLPAQIAPFLVERLGLSEAKRLAVTGARMDAREALAIRLVHEVHADADLDAAIARVVADILTCAPGALAATKALVRKARWTRPSDLVQQAAEAFSRAALGPEGIEGTGAFLQKRKPSWSPP